jgi:hypothetical protein
MNHFITAAIISCLFAVIQYFLSKERKLNIKDVGIVFSCSVGTLYGVEKYGAKSLNTISQVFTEPPAF